MGTLDKLPNDNSLVRAIHTAVKGRARYKVSGLYRSEALKSYLELRLSESEGIEQVRANHLTGNVLVIFHPDFSPCAIALLIQGIVLDCRKQTKKLPVRTAYSSPAPAEAKFLPINKIQLNKFAAHAQEPKVFPWHVWPADSVIAKGKSQTRVGSAILPPPPKKKQLDQVDNQLVLVWGAVCTLIFCTGLLHAYGLDEGILLAIQKLHTPERDRIMLGITFLGDPVVLLLICLGLKIGPLYYYRRSEVTTLGIAAVGAIGLNYLLKVRFGRVRPALWKWIVDVGHYSFPSGHAMMSIVIYGFISYILAKQFPQWREQIFALTVVLVVAIGLSRLYLGVHWPTDVVAGYAVGLVWLIVCILGLELWHKYCSSGRYS